MVIKVVVHPNKDGWWAEVVDLPGCYSHGNKLDDLKTNLAEAIKLHAEGLLDEGDESARNYQVENLEYDIKVNVQELFENLPIPVTEIAERAGVNRSLLAQYKKGRLISEDQAIKIFKVIKQIGQELSALPL